MPNTSSARLPRPFAARNDGAVEERGFKQEGLTAINVFYIFINELLNPYSNDGIVRKEVYVEKNNHLTIKNPEVGTLLLQPIHTSLSM
jgi:hypothetical protein